MIIGDRLRELREQKGLTRIQMEKRTGLLRSYLCRVEKGHTVPAVDTLEKLALGLRMPLYKLFCSGTKPPKSPGTLNNWGGAGALWGSTKKQARLLARFRRAFSRIEERERQLLLTMAQEMAQEDRPRVRRRSKPGKKRRRQ